MIEQTKQKTIKMIDEELKELKNTFVLKFKELFDRIIQVEANTNKNHVNDNTTNKNSIEENIKEYKCDICDVVFTNSKDFKSHKKSSHAKVFKCRLCELTFDISKELEEHIKTHDNSEKFKCDQCEKVFYLKFRLKKHEEIHSMNNISNCHYFNNGKSCPFEEIGCMFHHKESEFCKFGKLCKRKLCQYKHKEKDSSNIDDESNLQDDYEKLPEDEQWEARQLICDKMCYGMYVLHVCSEDALEAYRGCDIKNYV